MSIEIVPTGAALGAEIRNVDLARHEPGRLRVGLTCGHWGRAPDPDPEVVVRVREVANVL